MKAMNANIVRCCVQSKSALIGSKGYPLPQSDHFEEIDITAASASRLAELGIHLQQPYGPKNKLFVGDEVSDNNFTLTLPHASSSTIIIEKIKRMAGAIDILGADNLVCFCGTHGGTNTKLTVRGNKTMSYFSRDFTSIGSFWNLEGDERQIIVGEDCLLSWNIFARTSDSHTMFDLDNGSVLNAPSDISVGPHSWIGQSVMLLKGARVGAGAIVGAGAVVAGTIPPFCAAAGVPARVLRRRVSWSRANLFRSPTVSDDERARSTMFDSSG